METEEQKVVDIVDIHERDLCSRERERDGGVSKERDVPRYLATFISLVHSKRRRCNDNMGLFGFVKSSNYTSTRPINTCVKLTGLSIAFDEFKDV